jgi:hypothetical protein
VTTLIKFRLPRSGRLNFSLALLGADATARYRVCTCGGVRCRNTPSLFEQIAPTRMNALRNLETTRRLLSMLWISCGHTEPMHSHARS